MTKRIRKLYFGDNLEIMREHVADESVDLVYLDPPFNSNQAYNVLFKGDDSRPSPAQIEAFDDTWHWTSETQAEYALPFDENRDGFVMGEGAAVLILETEEGAATRGATPVAEILGGASTADAYHITAPHPEGKGAERAVRLALDDAGLEPGDISYINAHGTGTDLNDRTEGGVISRVFGDDQPAVSSIKGSTGHGLGASGSIEAAVVIESMRRAELPPNTGLTDLDPDIPLTDIVREPRAWVPGPTLSNSFGFGGHNTVVAFGPIT